jgi:predicted ABC-type ATPase
MGQPGAGKTTIGAPIARGMVGDAKLATINADDVKAALPEYSGWNAGALHEESSDVVEGMMVPRAIAGNHNMLIDITGTNSAKMDKMATALGQRGYDVHVVDITIPTELSIQRVNERFQRSGRFVNLDYARGINHKPDMTYTALKSNPYIKDWEQVDATDKPKILDQGHK